VETWECNRHLQNSDIPPSVPLGRICPESETWFFERSLGIIGVDKDIHFTAANIMAID